MLKILEELKPKGKSRNKRVRCLCDCGKEVTVRKDSYIQGRAQSCGCSRKKAIIAENKAPIGKDNNKQRVEELLQNIEEKYGSNPKYVAEKLNVRVKDLYDIPYNELREKLKEQGAEV